MRLEDMSREELIARVIELEQYIAAHSELMNSQMIQLAELQLKKVKK